MTQPFSQEPVEKAIFEALLSRRRSLAETGDPVKAKRLLTEIKYLSRAADMLLYHSVSEHMNVACDEIIGAGSHQRVVLAEARLKPAFFGKGAEELKTLSSPAKEDTQAPFSQVDGGGAGTFYGGEAGTFQQDGGGAGTLSMDGWQAGVSIPDYGWHAGTSSEEEDEGQGYLPPTAEGQAPFVIHGADTGQFKIRGAEVGQAGIVTMDDGLQGWTPTDDVAEGQAPSRKGFRYRRFLRSTIVC